MRLTPTVLAAGLLVLSPALPLRAETLTVSGIAAAGGTLYTLDVPTVEVEDGNIDEATIRALFSADARAAAPALATLDAKAIRIPELRMTAAAPPDGAESSAPAGTVTVYRNLEITGVVDGVAGSARIGAIEVTGAPEVRVTLGELSVSNLDIGALLAFYGIGTEAPSSEPVTIYTDIRFAGGKLTAASMSCDIGPAEIAEFKARPPKLGQEGLMALGLRLQEQEKAGSVDPETLWTAIEAYIDYMSSFEISPMSFGGFTCQGLDDAGRALRLAAGRLSLGGWSRAVFPPLSLSDFALDIANQGYVRFASATLKQMDFGPTIAALTAARGKIDARWFERNWNRIIPALDGLAISGLDIDVPDPQNPGARTKFKLGSLDATLAGYVEGIPASTQITIEGLTFPVPPPDEPLARALRQAGVTEITLGFGLDFDWDRESKTATLANLGVSGTRLGGVALSAVLGNVTPEVFSPDERVSMRAARQMRIKELRLKLDNAGLLPLLLAEGARGNGLTEAVYRTTLIAMSTGTTMALLGASPQTLETVAAITDFLNGRPGLDVTLTATDPDGIGLAEFELVQQNPRLLLGRIAVSAAARGDLPAEPAPAAVQGTAGQATSAQ